MLSFGVKISKVGPADPEIICLREIIQKDFLKTNASKLYSPVGNLAERAKKLPFVLVRLHQSLEILLLQLVYSNNENYEQNITSTVTNNEQSCLAAICP